MFVPCHFECGCCTRHLSNQTRKTAFSYYVMSYPLEHEADDACLFAEEVVDDELEAAVKKNWEEGLALIRRWGDKVDTLHHQTKVFVEVCRHQAEELAAATDAAVRDHTFRVPHTAGPPTATKRCPSEMIKQERKVKREDEDDAGEEMSPKLRKRLEEVFPKEVKKEEEE